MILIFEDMMLYNPRAVSKFKSPAALMFTPVTNLFLLLVSELNQQWASLPIKSRVQYVLWVMYMCGGISLKFEMGCLGYPARLSC